jgi:hypothetical protein
MREAENKYYESRVASGEIAPVKDPHFDKRWHAPKETHAKAPPPATP